MISVSTMRPFTRCLMTIGMIPTSYLVSMTYEEQLLWLCNYLEKEVIPALNNNAEALKEVQDLYVELKQYVDDYFSNLDVQEEINNKLDEMAESGELAEIIAQYLELTTTYTFNTIVDFKQASNLFDGANVRTAGYYAIGDDGGALYHVRTKVVSDVIDEGSIVSLEDENLVGVLVSKDITSRMFGVKLDGSDDTTYLQNAIAYCSNNILHLTRGTYSISSTLTINNVIIYGNDSIITCNEYFVNQNMLEMIGNVEIHHCNFNANDKAISITGAYISSNELILKDSTFYGTKANANSENFALNSAVYLVGQNSIVENCKIYNNHSHGLRLYAKTNHATASIKNSEFTNNGMDVTACGLCEYNREYGERYDHVEVDGCLAKENYASGFALHSTKNVTITNCVADTNGEHGYVLMDGENGIISNCIALNNHDFGIRIQGDYRSEEQGYENFILSNNIIKESDGIYLDNHIIKGIISNNMIDSSIAGKKGIVLGRSANKNDVIKDIKITGNLFTGVGLYYNNTIYTSFVLDDSILIDSNRFNFKVQDCYFVDGNRKNRYITPILQFSNVSDNLNSNPSSLNGWTGDINDNEVTPSGTNLLRKNIAVDGNPQFVSITLDKNDYNSEFSIGLRLRDSSSNLITFIDDGGVSGNQITQTSKFNTNKATKIFDLRDYTFNSTVSFIEVYLTVPSGTSEVMTINNIYCSLSNRNTIVNSVKTL